MSEQQTNQELVVVGTPAASPAPTPAAASSLPTPSPSQSPLPSPDYVKWLEKLPVAFVAFSSILYSVGFVVVNSFFATKGQTDLAFVNAKYLMAGALFCVLGAMFYFFVLRRILLIPRLVEQARHLKPKSFAFYVGLYAELEVYFSCAYWAAWATMILVPNPGTGPVLADNVLVLASLFDTWLFWNKAFSKKIRTRFMISGLVFAGAMSVFAWQMTTAKVHSPLLSLFGIGAGVATTAMLVFGSRNSSERRDLPWVATYSTVIVLRKVCTTRHPVRRRDVDVCSSVNWPAADLYQLG